LPTAWIVAKARLLRQGFGAVNAEIAIIFHLV
jgi:hypothetical protein